MLKKALSQDSEFSLPSAKGAKYDSQGQVPTLSGRRPWLAG